MCSKLKTYRVGDIINVTDYVANGSFASLKKNVTYLDYPDYAVLIRLVDYNNNWNGNFIYVDKNSYDFLKKSTVSPNDVIISNVGANFGTVFKAPELNQPMTLGPNTVLLKPDPNFIDQGYLYYSFYSPLGQQKIGNIVSGSAQPKFNKTDFRNLTIELPPLKIQKAIAYVLSTLEDKIELNKKINQTLESIAQAMFKSWFVDFDPIHAKANAKSVDEYDAIAKDLGISRKILNLFPSEFEESELGVIPKGWKINSLSNFITVIKGKSYKSSELQPSSTALVTLKSFLRGGGYRLDGLKQYDGKYKSEQEVKPGELIIAYTDVTQNADVIGKPAIVIEDKNIETLVASLDVGIVRIIKEHFSIGYLFFYFKTELFQNYILGYTSGTTVLHLSKNWIEKHSILTPPKNIIERFDKFCRNVFEQVNENIQETNTLDDIKTLLLPKLLSGEIDVSNLNLEPEDD
ncbi:MAG: restriction endonuclease subunit S [Legionella sp.]|nr:restriction endonuclease subunit S [Legionella sp.]